MKSPSPGVETLSKTSLKLSTKQANVKRVLDMAFCLLVLPLALPLMAICALAICLDSPGPVLFVQERIGKGRRRFRMYKFRTMHDSHRAFMKAFVSGRIGDDENGGVIYKPVQASQVTRVGRILRKTRLDELPQLINVLKGEMSLVGPRPNVPWKFEEYRGWQPERLEVLPGITGLAQVRGRSGMAFDSVVKYDIEYIERQSLVLDLKILWWTMLLDLKALWETMLSVIPEEGPTPTSEVQTPTPMPATVSKESSKLIEAYAIARLRDHVEGQPFHIGLEYVIEAGISRLLRQGFEVAPFTLQVLRRGTSFEVVVYAEDMEIRPAWVQSYVFSWSEEPSLLEFALRPTKSGRKQIRVEFYYQRHWLAQIQFAVEVVEAQELVPA